MLHLHFLLVRLKTKRTLKKKNCHSHRLTGRGGGGSRRAAVPPDFGQLRFFGQQEKIWAKPVLKDVSTFCLIILKI